MDFEDPFMTLFSLSNTAINLGTRERVATFLSAYQDNKQGSSNSFSYTAGFRLSWFGPALLSSVLGGYDKSRVDLSTALEADIWNTTIGSDPFQVPVNLASITSSADPNVSNETVGFVKGKVPLSSDSTLTVYI
jgi:hypothetical protein